jgi:RNA polymerase sigma-70 factor (ECF subfamily)
MNAMTPAEIQNTEDAGLALLKRCVSRDPEAYNELFERYNRKIFNTAYRILGEEASAEDALQETLLNIYRGIANFRGESKVSTWISRITINVCLGMLRKGKNRQFVNIEEDEFAGKLPSETTPDTDPFTHTSQNELRKLVNETFCRMSEKQRQAVRLHDMEGNTIQEIARITRCPAGTVKSRLFYGRQEFRDTFNLLMGRGAAAVPAAVS